METNSQEGEEEPQVNHSSSSSSAAAAAAAAAAGGGGGGEREEEDEAAAAAARVPLTPPSTAPRYIGKHRLAAAVAHLNHQIQSIQEELDELETVGESSLVCKELVTTVGSIPDPLLPVINGPAVVGWDRWFQGGSRARKRWI